MKGHWMYLFTRRARLAPGNTQAAMAWAAGITEKANQITGLNIRLFASRFSPANGTLSWSTFVPDLPTIEAAAEKLLVDDGLRLDARCRRPKFTLGGSDDTLLQIVHRHARPRPSRSNT